MGGCMARLTQPSYGSCAPINPRASDIQTPIGNGGEALEPGKVGYARGTKLAAAG